MNIAKLVRHNAPSTNDGLPSTRELLQDGSSSFLRELTVPKQAEVEYVRFKDSGFLLLEGRLWLMALSALLLCTV